MQLLQQPLQGRSKYRPLAGLGSLSIASYYPSIQSLLCSTCAQPEPRSRRQYRRRSLLQLSVGYGWSPEVEPPRLLLWCCWLLIELFEREKRSGSNGCYTEEGTGLEAPKQYVNCEDGFGITLVFSIFLMGDEVRHCLRRIWKKSLDGLCCIYWNAGEQRGAGLRHLH